jgi:hypothetical protein
MHGQGPVVDAAPWVASAQLPFGTGEAQLFDNLDELHERLSLAMNLRSLEPCSNRETLVQRSALRLVGDIGLTAMACTPTAAVVDDHHEAVVAVLQVGRIDYRIAGRSFSAEAGRTLMYLPGEAMKVRTYPHVGFAYNLNRPLLARYLVEQDRALSLERALLDLHRPWQVDLREPDTRSALQHLNLIIRLLDGTGEIVPGQSILSVLEDGIYQATAQLLLPAIRRG